MNRQFGSSQPGNNSPGNTPPGSVQSGNMQLGNIQSGNLDVIGRAQGLQIRLKKVGAFFTQEIVYPGETGPLVGGDSQDIHVIVDGTEIHSAYTYAGVSQKPQGSLYLQAVLEHADFSVETNFKLSVRSGFLDIETTFMAHKPLVLSAIENNYCFFGAMGVAEASGVSGAAGATNAGDAAGPVSVAGAGGPVPPMMMDARYVWLPHLKKEAGHVAGQHSFRSPCAYLQQGADVFAVIPSLTALRELWRDNWGLPAVLDYEKPNCLRFGLAKHAASYQPGENLYFRRHPLPTKVPTKESADGLYLSKGEKVSYSFSLMLRKDSAAGTALGEVVRFIWEKYGVQLLDNSWHQYLWFDDSARYAYDALFDRCRAWRAFSLNGVDCGGMVALITRKHEAAFQNQNDGKFAAEIPWKQYLLDRHARNRLELATKWLFEGTLERVYFDAHHNNLRTACGLAWFGARWQDQKLMDAARRTVNLYLAAPETADGLRPAVFSIGSRPGWLNGADGWAISEAFGVADMAEAGYWLLQYSGLCGDSASTAHRDEGSGVLAACGKMAATILNKQTEAGFYRRHFQEGAPGHPMEDVSENTSTSEQGWFSAYATVAAGRFMAAMAQRTGNQRLLDGAVKTARFIADQVLSGHNWSGQSTPADYYGGLKLQNCNVIYLAADLFRIIAQITGEKHWLDSGKAALDDLLLYQQLWTPPHLLMEGTGGFGAGNSEGVWNSPIQAMIALMLMDWYELSGEKEYFERGILALRASYAAMLVPENKILHQELHSQFGTADYGIIVDNYAYAGSDTGFSARVTPGWGCGTACAVTALVQKHYGDVYIDIPRQEAFGINGCRVKEALISPARVVLSIETMADYTEPKHSVRLDPNITGMLTLKFRIDSDHGDSHTRGSVGGVDGGVGSDRNTIMDGEVMQISVNGKRLGYYSAAQLSEGISWDWRHQNYQMEEVQNMTVDGVEKDERVFVGGQDVELGSIAEEYGDEHGDEHGDEVNLEEIESEANDSPADPSAAESVSIAEGEIVEDSIAKGENAEEGGSEENPGAEGDGAENGGAAGSSPGDGGEEGASSKDSGDDSGPDPDPDQEQ